MKTLVLSDRKKICLIADDTRSTRMMINIWMTRAGFECSSSENGYSAKAAIQRIFPDVLITDIEMPFFNGMELVCWTRQNLNTRISVLPIVVVTSLDDPELERIICEVGTRFVLRKPLSEQTLLLAVREAMGTVGFPTQSHSKFDSTVGPHDYLSQVRRMAENALKRDYKSDPS